MGLSKRQGPSLTDLAYFYYMLVSFAARLTPHCLFYIVQLELYCFFFMLMTLLSSAIISRYYLD